MPSDLPMRIRMDIRDKWNTEDGALQTAAADLAKVLGYTIKAEAEWPALWDVLSNNFPDKTTFVPAIAQVVVAWYQRLLWRVGQDQYSEWTEELLDALSQAKSGFSGVVWIQPGSVARSRWDKGLTKFYIEIPKAFTSLEAADYDFDRDFEQLLSATPQSTEEDLGSSIVEASHINETAGDWADIVVETRRTAPAPAAAREPQNMQVAKPMRMPVVGSTPRPADLMKSLGTHYLIFHAENIPAHIQCSHEPTLVFISEYLKKHGKTNLNDSERRQMYKYELQESYFCHGVRDLLVINTHMNIGFRASSFAVNNPALVFSLIEGVLGYKLVDTTGSRFTFRHETGFM